MRTILYLAIVALIATSSCSSSDSSSDSGSELPADVAQVVDDYMNAITAQDAEAWRETITDDFVNRRGTYGNVSQERWKQASVDETAAPYAGRIEFKAPLEYEQVGDLFVTGDGPWFVTIRQRWIERNEEYDDNLFEGNGTFVVVERDGVMKVAAEYWAGSIGALED
jgi:hypothetical protein